MSSNILKKSVIKIKGKSKKEKIINKSKGKRWF